MTGRECPDVDKAVPRPVLISPAIRGSPSTIIYNFLSARATINFTIHSFFIHQGRKRFNGFLMKSLISAPNGSSLTYNGQKLFLIVQIFCVRMTVNSRSSVLTDILTDIRLIDSVITSIFYINYDLLLIQYIYLIMRTLDASTIILFDIVK